MKNEEKQLATQKIIKVKTFPADGYPSYDSFEEWQKKNPALKVLDTKMFTETLTYQKIMVTYEEEV